MATVAVRRPRRDRLQRAGKRVVKGLPVPGGFDDVGTAVRRFEVDTSGRSAFSWDDSVRIDVRYVENWSLTSDFMILCKTLGAVVRGSGAY